MYVGVRFSLGPHKENKQQFINLACGAVSDGSSPSPSASSYFRRDSVMS